MFKLVFFISILLQSKACALAARASSTSWSSCIHRKLNRDSEQIIGRHFLFICDFVVVMSFKVADYAELMHLGLIL
jgi:hypothetical protein